MHRMARMNFRLWQPEFLFKFQPLSAKIDQQTCIFSGGNKVIHCLHLMRCHQILNSLQLNDEFIFNQKIRRKFSD